MKDREFTLYSDESVKPGWQIFQSSENNTACERAVGLQLLRRENEKVQFRVIFTLPPLERYEISRPKKSRAAATNRETGDGLDFGKCPPDMFCVTLRVFSRAFCIFVLDKALTFKNNVFYLFLWSELALLVRLIKQTNCSEF